MSEVVHSPEPWAVSPNDPLLLTDASGSNIVYAFSIHGIGLPRAKQNLRRVLACVNALAGVPTEAIERLPDDVDGFVAALMAARKGGAPS